MEFLTSKQLKDLTTLRRWLHQHPELSGNEKQTSSRLEEFLSSTRPTKLITGLGGYGIGAVYLFDNKGPTLLIRADMDALPIAEINTFLHKSQTDGVSHKCGHDGHSTILAGLALALSNNPFNTGRVVLLFQPAEETGEGAKRVLQDEAFKMIQPDYVLALHNLPGFATDTIVLRKGPFAAASMGIIVEMHGKSSHAAYPGHGNSPALMLAEAIQQIPALPAKIGQRLHSFAMATIIHARLGERAFGTNPGHAVLMATLRAFTNHDMELLKKQTKMLIHELAERHKLRIEISYTDEFPATENDDMIVDILHEVAEKCGRPIVQPAEPFRWSEDFGHFTMKYPGALFGVGSGIDTPALHNPDYDFPDEIIPGAIEILYQTAQKLLRK